MPTWGAPQGALGKPRHPFDRSSLDGPHADSTYPQRLGLNDPQ
jgi:hypothetical protein